MAGARKSSFALAVALLTLEKAFQAHCCRDLPSSAALLLQVAQDADGKTSPRPLVPVKAVTDAYSSSSHHTKLLTAHFEGAHPVATGATEHKKSSKTAEQGRMADSTSAYTIQSLSSIDLTTRQLMAANAASSSSKAMPAPGNAEQLAQKGLKADIAEALKGSGSPTKNAGDRH